jgi:hypothetical protein
VQEEVFDEVEALVTSVLDGYNVCIFPYGQVRVSVCVFPCVCVCWYRYPLYDYSVCVFAFGRARACLCPCEPAIWCCRYALYGYSACMSRHGRARTLMFGAYAYPGTDSGSSLRSCRGGGQCK